MPWETVNFTSSAVAEGKCPFALTKSYTPAPKMPLHDTSHCFPPQTL